MFAPVFESESFEVVPIADRVEALCFSLESLCTINRAYLRAMPSTPDLYASGVRYLPERPGDVNRFQDIPRAMALGGTHCVGLSAWRAAELRERCGEAAAFRISTYPNVAGGVLYHVQVERPGGRVDDPSRRLGMRLAGE